MTFANLQPKAGDTILTCGHPDRKPTGGEVMNIEKYRRLSLSYRFNVDCGAWESWSATCVFLASAIILAAFEVQHVDMPESLFWTLIIAMGITGAGGLVVLIVESIRRVADFTHSFTIEPPRIYRKSQPQTTTPAQDAALSALAADGG